MLINLLEYFVHTVKSYPHKTAVVDGEKSVTFLELESKSKLIASIIVNKFENKNNPIAVYLPKSIECVVVDLAVLYSGNFYMNLDIKSPVIRIQNILKQIKPVVIITNNEYLNAINKVSDDFILINIDNLEQLPHADMEVIDTRLKCLIDTDPLCIINTSGSTGTPKGVVLNHKSFIDFTEWAIETLKIKDFERIGSLSPVVFDIFSFELCMLMSKGCTIVILAEAMAAFPIKILGLLNEHKITFIFWVPTIMVNIANMDLLSRISLPDLQTIWFAGEVFPTKQFNYWRRQLPHAKFINLYGPIEITLDCTYFIVDRELPDDEPIPIGYPCHNTDVLILNERNEIASVKEEGELCVRGTSLAMGYYNNLEKTKEVFVQNPLNSSYPEIIYRTGDIVLMNEHNEIIFKGRKDSLVKHSGYRIELGEIEHVIVNIIKLVENGCVVYNFKKKEITLFYESSKESTISEMKKAIGTVFPKYMIPTSFHKLPELPRNINGKIDRLLLHQIANNG
jgi:amino acid adenylation domain-containing protein